MPLRSTWLAAMSMTLMMKAMAKAQIRLLRTHVWRICWLEQAVAAHQGAPEREKGTAERWNQEPPALLHMGCPPGRTGTLGLGQARRAQAPSANPWFLPCSSSWPSRGVPGISHSLSTSTGHSSAVPRWLSSSVMIMFSMSFMDRCSQKVS